MNRPVRLSMLGLMLGVGVLLAADSPPDPTKVVVYYFHGNARCYTCRTMEGLTRKSLSAFPSALAAKTLEFKLVNIEDPAHEHFVDDFQLMTRGVVVAREQAGKVLEYTALTRVWELVGQEDAFLEYLQTGIRPLLAAPADTTGKVGE